MDDHSERQADCVGENMSLAAFDLLASVITTWAASLGGFDRLTVDHAGGGAGLTVGGLAYVHQQHMVDGLPQSRVPPVIKVPLHRRVRRESFGSRRHWQPDSAI